MSTELPSDIAPEPANLRFLRRLVTVLTIVMIGGLLTIVALFVIRFSTPAVQFPDNLKLPTGVMAETFTQGRGWYAVVTTDQQLLIFDAKTGDLRQTIAIE